MLGSPKTTPPHCTVATKRPLAKASRRVARAEAAASVLQPRCQSESTVSVVYSPFLLKDIMVNIQWVDNQECVSYIEMWVCLKMCPAQGKVLILFVAHIPVVPHKAVAEGSKTGNLEDRLVVVNHGWQTESTDGPKGGWSYFFWSGCNGCSGHLAGHLAGHLTHNCWM